MSQIIETGLIINGLTGDVETIKTQNSFGVITSVVKDTGNVGIGTDNPSEKLEVSGKTKTTTLQITSGATNIGSFLRLSDIFGNTEWDNPNLINSVSSNLPFSTNTINNNVTISILDAKADDTTKGVSTFNSSDFNDNNSGLISIDYINGQSASATTKGFLTESDWNLFNNKQNDITITTTGTSGPATLNPATNILNIPQYGGANSSSGSSAGGFGYILLMGFNTSNAVESSASPDTYVFGPNIDGGWLILTDNRFSRSLRAIKSGSIKSASVMVELNNSTFAGPTTGATMNLFLYNQTSATTHTIDSTFPVFSSTTNGWGGTTQPSRNTFYEFNPPVTVTQNDLLQIRFTPRSFSQGWVNDVTIGAMVINLFIE
jgi:hypothetical protein